MKVVERQQALKKGLLRYFTGQKCKNGHLAERTTKEWKCVECVRERNHRQRAKHYKKRRAAEKKYFNEHKKEYRVRSSQRYYNDHTQTLQDYKAAYAENPEVPKARAMSYFKRHRQHQLQNMRERYRLTKVKNHQRFIEQAYQIYSEGITSNDYNESKLKYFIAGFIHDQYGLGVTKEVIRGSSRADLYVEQLNLVIECKVESTPWSLAHCNRQRQKYYKNFGQNASVVFVSPEGKYGISVCDLPEFIETLTASRSEHQQKSL